MTALRALVLALGCLWLGGAAAQSRSGLEFAAEELRRLQASDAENPGMLWVERGAQLWGEGCAACHGDARASMKGVATRYPVFAKGRLLNLEGRINECRVERQKAPALGYESAELLALTAYVAHQSRGMPIAVSVAPEARDRFDAGRAAYLQRRGQLNLACAHCHEASSGKRIGQETISQGQSNAFPAYRLEWQGLGSLHRRLRACMFALRAELPAYGSEQLLELELYLAWRARGLPVEAPAVRR
jgi:sulfur-oxidizing protein SoxA